MENWALTMLNEYKRKRDFNVTPEPAGSTKAARSKKKKASLSFVIQKHAARRLHYDFRLEINGVMVSWAVPKGPALNPSDKRLAVMTEDHPMEYSDFEGIIPEHQYGAGEVIIWDRGTYSPDDDAVYSWDDKEEASRRMKDGLNKGKLSFSLRGEKLHGSWTLVKLRDKEKDWLLIKHKDEYADAKADVTELDASVVSGQTIEDLQEYGAKRIWTSKGEQKADPATTGKSTKSKKGLPKGKVVQFPRIKNRVDPAKLKEDLDESIKGGRRAAFPKDFSPMLATLADEPFSKEGWFFEPKLDGVRVLAYVKDGNVRLSSRRGLDLTHNYPSVTQSMSNLEGKFVFDGEVVALDENGRPSFQYLQQSSGRLKSFGDNRDGTTSRLMYYVFDVLFANGKDLTDLPLVQRKKILTLALPPSTTVKIVDSLGSDGTVAFGACLEHGLEGIIAKKEGSTYEVGKRTRSWLKIKTSMSAEFIVCGYTEGTGSRGKTFGSLLLGEYGSNGQLQYVGGVGTGFSDKRLQALLNRMKPLVVKTCPFKRKPRGKVNPTWLKPELVAEVKFMERTQDNQLRAPVFMHLREDIEPKAVKEAPIVHIETKPDPKKSNRSTADKKPKGKVVNSEVVESVLSQLDGEQEKMTLSVDKFSVPLTNLNKEFWPKHGGKPRITKRDYLRYLAQVSPFLIPHLQDRLMTLVRFPNGINAGRFYQKHWEHKLPEFVETAVVFTEKEGKDQDFLLCNNLPTLLWLGQIADLELHTSHTRVVAEPDATHISADMTGSVEQLDNSIGNYPDFIVLDLDPYLYSGKEKTGAEPELHRKGFENCREAALYLKDHLDALGINSFVKTSGKTGLHIYVPILRNVDYDTVRSLSQIICSHVLKEHPDEVTMEWAVKNRTGKVFLDHNMNARSKSLASIYSARVSPEACISTPVDWDELEEIYPTDFDMQTVPQRLAQIGDLWSDILDHKNDLNAIAQKAPPARSRRRRR